MNNRRIILILLFHRNNVVFVKVTVPSIALWLCNRNSKNQGIEGTNEGLVLGPLLFNIEFIDLSLLRENDDIPLMIMIPLSILVQEIFCNYQTLRYCKQNFQMI